MMLVTSLFITAGCSAAGKATTYMTNTFEVDFETDSHGVVTKQNTFERTMDLGQREQFIVLVVDTPASFVGATVVCTKPGGKEIIGKTILTSSKTVAKRHSESKGTVYRGANGCNVDAGTYGVALVVLPDNRVIDTQARIIVHPHGYKKP